MIVNLPDIAAHSPSKEGLILMTGLPEQAENKKNNALEKYPFHGYFGVTPRVDC